MTETIIISTMEPNTAQGSALWTNGWRKSKPSLNFSELKALRKLKPIMRKKGKNPTYYSVVMFVSQF